MDFSFLIDFLTPAKIGGILLILGATALFFGYADVSIIIYFFADICWLILGIKSGDIFGALTIAIGMLLGLGVWLKMRFGIFRKHLKKD